MGSVAPARKYPELPRWWDIAYGAAHMCWGCGCEPDGQFCDLHYGRRERPLCVTCWELVAAVLRQLPRPPAGHSSQARPMTRMLLRARAQ